MLLGAQSGACTAGELKATSMGDPESYRCSCRELITECAFWKEVAGEMAVRGQPNFDITNAGTNHLATNSRYADRLLAPLHRGPLLECVRDSALSVSARWRRHLRHANARNLALIESLLAVTEAGLVVDSSKLALRAKYLRQIRGLEIKVVRVIRDGRAVSLTYMDDWNFADAADPKLRSGGAGVRKAPPRRSMAEAAHEWKRSNEAADCLTAMLPKTQWTEVRYEELCAAPEATLHRLVEFVGLDPDKLILDFRAREQHVIGNGMRMDSTSEIRLDERWREHLTAEDLAVFDRVAGDLNRKYGYS
jgi:hypothetical protein